MMAFVLLLAFKNVWHLDILCKILYNPESVNFTD